MKAIFWISISIIIYTYLLYPLILHLLSISRPKPLRKLQYEPFVTIIIAAYNEEANISSKLNNTLALDYPREKMEIIVASDGSTDGTDGIVSSFVAEGVQLLQQQPRKGKTAAQNKAVKLAKGDIIIFSDANTIYKEDAIKNIVSNFSDPEVGCVGGNVYHISDLENPIDAGGGLYWKYEMWIKQRESHIGSLTGVYGGIYGVRRGIYRPLPEDLISDFLIALETYRIGYRTVFEPEAIGFEKAHANVNAEFRMRVRVALRSFRAIISSRWALNIFDNPQMAWQLLSHKVFRYSIPLFLIILFLSNFFISGTFYKVSLLAQTLFYVLAAVGLISIGKINKGSIFFIPLYFCLVNTASLVAFAKMLMGEKYITWETIRN